MRLVLLAATVRATSAALALPSVLTTRGHNATAYVVAAAPGGCGAAPHLRVACGKPRRVFAEELPAAVLITRCAFSKVDQLRVKLNMASCYNHLGREEESLAIKREAYAAFTASSKVSANHRLSAAVNLASALIDSSVTRNLDEALPFLLARIPEAQQSLGKDHDTTFKLQRMYAQCCHGKGDLTECVATLEDLERRQRRVLGPNHPQTKATEKYGASVCALIRKLSLSIRDA